MVFYVFWPTLANIPAWVGGLGPDLYGVEEIQEGHRKGERKNGLRSNTKAGVVDFVIGDP
jgi:hypothetical protein